MSDPAPEPSLRLSLSGDGRVLLIARGDHTADLRNIQLSFAGSVWIERGVIAVELGSLLAGLSGLARWPTRDVVWADDLAKLVRSAADDVKEFRRVDTGLSEASLVNASQIAELTGGNWVGNLTTNQQRDVGRLLNAIHGANFSVPGAGKTRVALAVYSMLRSRDEIDRLVVVAPKSAHESWRNESQVVFRDIPAFSVLRSAASQFGEISLINYEMLPPMKMRLAQYLLSGRTLLILDEAHRMKRGAEGKYGQICLNLGPLARRRLILSGTPAPNGLSDLKSLMEFVWPGNGAKLVAATTSGRKSSNSRLQRFFTRTTKRDLGLPKLTVTIERLDLPPLHRRIYDALLGKFGGQLAASEEVDDLGRIVVYLLMAATSPALLAIGSSQYEALQFRVPPLRLAPTDKMRSLLAELPSLEMSPKILEAVRIVRDNASHGRKTLVWSTFIRNVRTLESLLTDLNPTVIIGSTSDEDRSSSLARFRSSADSAVLLSNPATLGEGVSLHDVCHEAVYLDRDFAAGRYLQSLDRIHRLGLRPDQETRIRILVANGTIDELVEQRLDFKVDWMSKVLDDESLRELTDLEDDLEHGSVIDASDVGAVWKYLGRLDAS